MAEEGDERVVEVRLTKGQATAAAAVLRGYLAHQRERLGDRAGTNPNFQLVDGALRALDEHLAAIRDSRPASTTPGLS